jgi:glyoxylase-like metal-dependent hydrolase (beta-lactamase superfamily II)
MKLADHLFAYPWESMVENNCNTYLVDGKVPMLIDPGHHHLFPHLKAELLKDGFEPSDIKLVVATHPHPDHFEAVQDFLTLGSTIAMHPEGERFMAEQGAMIFRMMGLRPPPYRVDLHLVEGDFAVGDHQFQVMYAPGHAPGSICLYWPKVKALFTGDVIFSRSLGRTDLPGGRSALLKASIDRLTELDVELLLPGHGPAIRGKAAVEENFYLVRSSFFHFI